MWDVEVSTMLKTLNEGFPQVDRFPAEYVRQVVANRSVPWGNDALVASATDHQAIGDNGPVRVRVYQPHGSAGKLPAIVFLHGGGFVLCSIESHDGFCREMSQETNSVVISVDYRLAPEHKAPAAMEDSLTGIRWVIARADRLGIDPDRIAVSGDSAGGYLALRSALDHLGGGGSALAALILFYPMVDSDCDRESYRRFEWGYVHTTAATHWYWHQYLGSPPLGASGDGRILESDGLDDLPQTMIVAAAQDPLVDEGRELTRALLAARTPVLHREYGAMFHGFITNSSLSAARAARVRTWRDVRAALASSGPAPSRPSTPIS